MIDEIKNKLRDFASERDWDKFHTPKNLAMAIAGETGELIEIFQWKNESESSKGSLSDNDLSHIKEEMSDVLLYLIRLADVLDIDLIKEANNKIELNRIKYPITLSRGNAKKYNRRDE